MPSELRLIRYRNPQRKLKGAVTIRVESDGVHVHALETGRPKRRKSGMFVVNCDCLGLVGAGRTATAARQSLERTVMAHVEGILKHGGLTALLQTLHERGWQLDVEGGAPAGGLAYEIKTTSAA